MWKNPWARIARHTMAGVVPMPGSQAAREMLVPGMARSSCCEGVGSAPMPLLAMTLVPIMLGMEQPDGGR